MVEPKRETSGKGLISPKTWRRLRIAVQIIFFLAFLTIFILAPQQKFSHLIISLPLRLSPLVMVGSSIAARVILPGIALAILFLLFSMFFGRAWCGWLCPLGSIIEVFSLKKNRDFKLTNGWRKIKYVLFFLLVSAAVFQNLALLSLDPITILYRTFTITIWPVFSLIVQKGENLGYQISSLRPAVNYFDNLIRPGLFSNNQIFYYQSVVIFCLFMLVIGLNYFAKRFWCRYICPMAGMLGFISRISVFKRRVTEECISCGKCELVCQTETVESLLNYRSDPAECTLCMDCIASCPNRSNEISIQLLPSSKMPYDPSRREALISVGAAAVGAALINIEPDHFNNPTFLIRPPGVNEEEFLNQCVRCGECMRVCPTNAVQPSILESGISGFWTPILVPRIGYCDYSCNQCGQICPVQAIPPLPLEEKRTTPIGLAYIDQNRCIPWADQKDCIVCEEMCPTPTKAITLTRHQSSRKNSGVLVPVVNRDICIGCGICENKCPVSGQAAIKVFVLKNT